MGFLKGFVLMFAALCVVCIAGLVALSMGRYPISFSEVVSAFYSQFCSGFSSTEIESTQSHIVFTFRLPRVILAIIIGAGLSVAGIAFQSLFKNPLATPDILGVSNGASFGAVVGLILGLSVGYVCFLGFICGIAALILVVAIGYNKQMPLQSTNMILSGIIISAFFQSLLGICKYIADPQDTLPTITYWLLGSLEKALDVPSIVSCCVIIVASFVIYILRWKLNLLMLQDDEAISLGVNLRNLRLLVILSSTLIVTCAICMCGVIGWVGLLVPHIARLLVGNNTAHIVPLSLFIGALFLLFVDTLSRTMLEAQIPISILTSLCGAPFFIYILRSNQRYGYAAR